MQETVGKLDGGSWHLKFGNKADDENDNDVPYRLKTCFTDLSCRLRRFKQRRICVLGDVKHQMFEKDLTSSFVADIFGLV